MAKDALSFSCVLVIVWCVLQIHWSGCLGETNFLSKEKQVLDSLLHHSRYDPRVRPVGVNGTGRGPATNVSINVYLSAITNVDDVKMKLTLQMLLRQTWVDPRLTFDDYGGKMRTLNLLDKTKIWQPDIFFPNEIGGFVHSVLGPNTFIRILSGQVLTSNRLSLTLTCPMDLRWFPFDRQGCDLQFESYGLTSKDLFLSWDETNPVGRGKLRFPRFSLDTIETLTTQSQTKTGEYHGLKLVLHLKRHLTHSFLRGFLPSGFLVIVSWVAFWQDPQAVVARVIIGIATLLAAGAHAFAYTWSTPAVDYVTSMDVWLGVCMAFVFAALLMSSTVDFKTRESASKPPPADGSGEAGEPPHKNMADKKKHKQEGNGGEEGGRFQALRSLKDRLPEGPIRFDIISRILFPVLFMLFSVFYWAVNLCHRG